VLAGGWSWASGRIVSTPLDLNRFIPGYVGGELFGRRVAAERARFIPGGSEPTGPGRNTAGLALFRYDTRCSTVFGHTGNTLGPEGRTGRSRLSRRAESAVGRHGDLPQPHDLAGQVLDHEEHEATLAGPEGRRAGPAGIARHVGLPDGPWRDLECDPQLGEG
jgi:hypothetical protein